MFVQTKNIIATAMIEMNTFPHAGFDHNIFSPSLWILVLSKA